VVEKCTSKGIGAAKQCLQPLTKTASSFGLVTPVVHLSSFVLAALPTWVESTILAVTVLRTMVLATATFREVVVRSRGRSRGRRRRSLFRLVTPVVHFRPGVLAALSTRVESSMLAIAVGAACILTASSLGEPIVGGGSGCRGRCARIVAPLVILSPFVLSALAALDESSVVAVAVDFATRPASIRR